MRLKTDKKFDLFNFILILKYCVKKINFDSTNKVEIKFLNNFDDSLLKKLIIVENFQHVIEQILNESFDTGIEELRYSGWVAKPLDLVYGMDLVVRDLTNDRIVQILPRTKKLKEAERKILDNLIISSLIRYSGIIFFSKKSKIFSTLPSGITINFTKGFLILIEPESVEIFKRLLYKRKVYQSSPSVIAVKEEFVKFEITVSEKGHLLKNFTRWPRLLVKDFINNKTFTSPLWLKSKTITDCLAAQNLSILNKYTNFEDLLKNINYLNSTPLTIDWDLFEKFNILFKTNKSLAINAFSLIQLKQKPQGGVLILDNNDRIKVDDAKFQKITNSMITFELIKKQLTRIKQFENGVFYLQYRLDSRSRIYVYNWPINYQLIHVVRSTIQFKFDETKPNYDLFLKLPEIRNNLYNAKYLMLDSVTDQKRLLIWMCTNLTKVGTDPLTLSFSDKIKSESMLMILSEFAPKSMSSLSQKIEFWVTHFNDFINSPLKDTWESWTNLLELADEEILYLFKLQTSLRNLKNDDFSSIIWLDASSNAIQLVTLRTGAFDDLLLQTTNIKENKTPFPNVYHYGHYLLSNTNHDKICKSLGITRDELLSLTDVKDFKYRSMPATYGKTSYANIDDMKYKYKNHEIWKKLSPDKQQIVAQYFWDLTFKVLKDIGYDINKYLNDCKNISDDIPAWFSDFELPIIPFSFEKSKRQELLKKINKLEYDLTSENETTVKQKLEKSIKNYKKKLKNDEKIFWARTRIETDVKIMTIRVPKEINLLDSKKTKIGLAANTIHAYDASVLLMAIKMCSRAGIKVLVIHDSIGCSIANAPLVKIIFKVANIRILKKNQKVAPYPFKKVLVIENPLELYKNILESHNFFK